MDVIDVKKTAFDVVLFYWKNKLWLNRKSEIKPMSGMQYLGGIDMSIYKKYIPTFFIATINEKIIGVNSGHKTSNSSYRSRGIWVDPKYRNKGVSQQLFSAIKNNAIKEDCNNIWSIPRKGALPAYEKFGFTRTSEFTDKNMEFGPNCYVLYKL